MFTMTSGKCSTIFYLHHFHIPFFPIQDTSVLSPIIPASLLILLTIYYAINSPDKMLENEAMMFLAAMVGPFIKFTIYMMVCSMGL